ncbi:polyprenyl synthetase family protein [Chryseolinea sp. T2]|uniref:polyprenyl synthetase family protein n=1 Tax=Chryseolinea sp. T2 TaxID=3129255 RepID=UPI0030768C5B
MVNATAQYYQWIEREIAKGKYGKSPESLYEPIRYIMGIGGKRLRPMLTLYGYSLFKDNVKDIVKYAVAVEAFHNFTLMHDDIMDKAPLRRGQPTVHKKWNVNTAILSGDVMLVKVYDMFLSLDPLLLPKVLSAFNRCASEVCEGQQWDMEFEQKQKVSEADYINMIRLKTSVLIGFSLELGGILAGASESDCRALRTFGTNIGIGFQLQDDYLDAYADPLKFGKQVGGDIIANKKTFLLIKALEKATGKNKRELSEWLTASRFRKEEKVNAVKTIFDRLGIAILTERKTNQYFKKGFGDLDRLSCDQTKTQELRAFAEKLISRQT